MRSLLSSRNALNYGIIGASVLGLADALYMLAYHQRLIRSLACPFFGEGCNVVGRSKHARHLGVPNAAIGAIGYAVMFGLALGKGSASARSTTVTSVLLAITSLSAAVVSAFLTWEQAARVKAWCFWCLSSAAINALILPLALWELRTVSLFGKRRGHATRGTTPRGDPN